MHGVAIETGMLPIHSKLAVFSNNELKRLVEPAILTVSEKDGSKAVFQRLGTKIIKTQHKKS